MKLTILGASPACQNRGGACSGYMLEQEGAAVLIDCGSGVFSRLQQFVAPESVQAVVISHMHADHILDLIQYRYFLFFCHLDGRRFRRPRLYLPPGGHKLLLTLSGVQDPSRTFFEDCFEVVEYNGTREIHEGPFEITFLPVVHVPHTYAVRVRGNATFAFSADSGPCEALARIASNCDLFLCECGNRETSTYPFHLTPRQAAAVASTAGARGLLLTHRWWRHGEEDAISEARENYDGPIELAREGMQMLIEPPAIRPAAGIFDAR